MRVKELIRLFLSTPYYNVFMVAALKNAVRTAKRIYGPYQLNEVPFQLGLDVVPQSARAEELEDLSAAGGTIDAVLGRILTARSLVAVGALTLAIELTFIIEWQWGWLGEWVYSTAVKGFYLMVIAPPAVFLAVLGLVLAARPGLRTAALRSGLRPVGVAGFTLLFVGSLTWLASAILRVRDATEALDRFFDELADTPFVVLIPVVAFVLAMGMFWGVTFLAAALYLVQRNAMSRDRSLPLLPPIVAVLVAWAYCAVTGALGLEPEHLSGWRAALSRFGPPVAITILAAFEVLRLRRKHGVGFRGPVAVVRAKPG